MSVTLPSPTANDIPDLMRSNRKVLSDLTATHGIRYRPNPAGLIPPNLCAQATLHIDRMRHRLKMVNSDTIALTTQMIKFETVRNRAIGNLVIQPMGGNVAPVVLGNTVSSIIQSILPNVTRRLVSTVNDLVRISKLPSVPSPLAPVTTDVHPRNPNRTSVSERSKLNPIYRLATSTLACPVCNFGIVWARHFPTSCQVVRIRHGPE